MRYILFVVDKYKREYTRSKQALSRPSFGIQSLRAKVKWMSMFWFWFTQNDVPIYSLYIQRNPFTPPTSVHWIVIDRLIMMTYLSVEPVAVVQVYNPVAAAALCSITQSHFIALWPNSRQQQHSLSWFSVIEFRYLIAIALCQPIVLTCTETTYYVPTRVNR